MIAGLYDAWPISTMPGHYNTRMAVPCHLSIDVTPTAGSTSSTGTLGFTLTSETGLSSETTIHAIINECGIPGTGTYSSTDFNYALRWNMAGANGTAVSFGDSPETIELDMDYTIDSSWDWDELYLTTFVQNNSNKEIVNSHMVKMSDLITSGIEGGDIDLDTPSLSVISPAQGAIQFSTSSLAGTGTISLYSVDGRLVESRSVQNGQGTFTTTSTGLYLLRLETSGGIASSKSVVVIR